MKNNSNSNTEIPLSEKVKSLPGFFGIHLEEQAPYEVIKSDDGVEVRCYKPQIHAKITVRGDFKTAQKEAFNILAGYIFGENQLKEKIPMTTPILLENKPEHKKELSQEWTMTFILPQNYFIHSAPSPQDRRITLHERPLQLVASVSYAGINNEEKVNEYMELLKKWLKKRPWYIPLNGFQAAQFDGPLTIPFFRKNEIHVEVKHLH